MKKNRTTRLEKVKSLIIPQTLAPININETFYGKNIYLEIGCGKGSFVTGMSKLHPSAEFIAVEKVIDVMLMAMEKAIADNCENIKFLNADAEKIDDLIAKYSIDKLFLNFSDPWPKARHEKRRLTSPQFLYRYKNILKENGIIYQKTDNIDLFEYSLESFNSNGFEIIDYTYDLHSSIYNDFNIQTEYEKNFSQKGFKINYLEAKIKN